ncbi:DUF3786 domain-containing protein [Chloroflexota bacterium]
MENRRFEVPDNKDYEYALSQAYKLACEQITGLEDIEEQCRYSGSECKTIGQGWEITLSYLHQPCKITIPDVDVVSADSDQEIPLREKVLILHYFLGAKDIPLSRKLIAFSELPEGKVYNRTFVKRTNNHLARIFGNEPERLLEAGKIFGGYKTDYGDISVTVPAFEYVPITFVLWKGDEEFSPEANILFDSTTTDYLSTEDLIVLCEIITWKMVRSLG